MCSNIKSLSKEYIQKRDEFMQEDVFNHSEKKFKSFLGKFPGLMSYLH